MIVIESWNKKAVTALQIYHLSKSISKKRELLSLRHEKIDRWNIWLKVYIFIIILRLFKILASVHLLPVDMRDQNDVHFTLYCTYNLFDILVVRFIDIKWALNDFNALKLTPFREKLGKFNAFEYFFFCIFESVIIFQYNLPRKLFVLYKWEELRVLHLQSVFMSEAIIFLH